MCNHSGCDMTSVTQWAVKATGRHGDCHMEPERLRIGSIGVTVRGMANKKPKAPDTDVPVAFNIRGVTAADVEALDRAVARRERDATASGARFSRGSVLLAIIREGLAREDAGDKGAK